MAIVRHGRRPGDPGALPVDLEAAIEAELRRAPGDPLAPGRVYERRIAADRAGRRQGGVYYTPPHLVDFVVEKAVGAAVDAGTPPRVIDPACGGGVFLIAALRRGVPAARLVGVDVDPVAAEICRWALAIAGASEARVVCADALADAPPVDGDAGAVIGNPPWGQKGLRFPPEEARRLRACFATARGVLDPFKLFVERGLELLAPGGRLGMVLPDIVLLKDQQRVRDLLLEQTAIEWLAHAGRAFDGVNLDAAVVVARVARAGAPSPEQTVSIWRELPPAWREAPPETHRLSQRVFGELPGHRFNLYLDEPTLALLGRLGELPRFGDRFEVHEGVHTGNARAKLFVPERRGPDCVPVIVGRGELTPYRLAWAGTWLDRDPARLDRDAGDYANLGRPEWHRAGKLVVRRTGDRVICARDTGGYHVSNNAFVALPRELMTDAELRAHAGLLNSRFMTWYFRAVQPRVGRLFAELKIQHLVDFPLPRADLGPLADAVSLIEAGGGDPAEVDRLVDEAFGLSAAERALVGGASEP